MDPVPNFTKADDLDYAAGFEDSIFLINATKWLKKIKQKDLLKNRHIKIFAENFDNQSTFISRFIKPSGQRPPMLIYEENDDENIGRAARYVSLIPFVEDSQSWNSNVEMPDCWCTDSQFLTLGFGDYEEHAILLLNYFNYIDSNSNSGVQCESFLVLGDAHPEGMTTYVMRKTKDNCNIKEVEFWNAKTGDVFHFDKSIERNKFLCLTVNQSYKMTQSNKESICQLKSIGAIVSSDNIYVNIQKDSDPGLINFDLNNTSHWLPFLTEQSRQKYFPKGIETVQTNIEYKDVILSKADTIKEEIKVFLKNKIKKERETIANGQNPLMTQFIEKEGIEAILQNYETICKRSIKSRIQSSNVNQSSLQENQNQIRLKLQNLTPQNENLLQEIQTQILNLKLPPNIQSQNLFINLESIKRQIQEKINIFERQGQAGNIIIQLTQMKEQIDYTIKNAEDNNHLRTLFGNQNQIQSLFVTKTGNIYGFPINVSFTSNEKIWEQVKLTDVHLAAHEKCIFSLSVYVEPYPSEVYSVWIFLVVINDEF